MWTMERKMGKVLILVNYLDQFFVDKIAKRGYTVFQVYKEMPFVMRSVRMALSRMAVRVPSFFFGSWKNDLTGYNTIIVFDCDAMLSVVKYIKQHSNARVIGWFWNPLYGRNYLKNMTKLCEVWSFDKEDCKKYGLKSNTQFYFKDIYTAKLQQCKYDVIFVGQDKGRLEKLMQLKTEFEKLGLRTLFHITPNRNHFNFFNRNRYLYGRRIPYQEVLSYISQSKTILEYVSYGQSGLTLRSLESLFLRKKLITNNPRVRDMDFYNAENIFIIGEDDISKLPSFIDSPYVDVGEYNIQEYDFDEWINRFFSE